MESLNIVLRNVKSYRIDLSAVTIAQEEKGHYEQETETITYEYDGHHGESFPPPSIVTEEVPIGPRIWVVDVPEETKPDYEKREHARDQLQEIYTTSNWYSARYSAGVALQLPQDNLQNDLELWISRLENELKAANKETRNRTVEDVIELLKLSHSKDLADLLEKTWSGDNDAATRSKAVYILRQYNEHLNRLIKSWIPELEKQLEADTATRVRTVEEVAELLKVNHSWDLENLLKKTWRRNSDAAIRKKAGQALGYSRLRIWVHEILPKQQT